MVWQGQCALIYHSDWYGNAVKLTRDADGHLLKIETTNGRWLRLQHDEAQRVTRGWDSTVRSMSYEYDASGRLVRAIASTGAVQTYEDDAAHKMTRIVERHGTVISNAYDSLTAIGREYLVRRCHTRTPILAKFLGVYESNLRHVLTPLYESLNRVGPRAIAAKNEPLHCRANRLLEFRFELNEASQG